MVKTRQSNMDIQYRQKCERRAAYRQQCELQVYMPLNVPRVAGAPVTFSTDRQQLRRSQGTNQSSQREPPPLQGDRELRLVVLEDRQIISL
jgi:hypothetical protein